MSRIIDLSQQQLAPAFNVPMSYLYDESSVYLNAGGNKVYLEKPSYHTIRHQFRLVVDDHLLSMAGGSMVESGYLGQGLSNGAGFSIYGNDLSGGEGSFHQVFGGIGQADPDGDWIVARIYKPSPGGTPTINSKTILRIWPDGLYFGPYVHSTWTLVDTSDISSVNSDVTLGHPNYPWTAVNAKRVIRHANKQILAQSSTISETVLYTNSDRVAGTYQLVRVSYYAYTTTIGSAGVMQLLFKWHDGIAYKYEAVPDLDLTSGASPGEVKGVFTATLSPGVSPSYLWANLSYTATIVGGAGSPAFGAFMTVEVLDTYTP